MWKMMLVNKKWSENINRKFSTSVCVRNLNWYLQQEYWQ